VRIDEERAVWVGGAVAVAATVVLTVVAAALESTVNQPGSRTLAPPVLWAFGGGLGLCLGAGTASWVTRRIGPGVAAAAVGLVPFLLLVIVGYNDKSLRLEDQLVGTLVIVVLPGFVAAALVAVAAAFASRAFGARQPKPARKSVTT